MPFYHRPPADRGPLRPRSPMASGQAAATPTPAELAEAVGIGYAVVDLETTGLSPATDSILEIALVLTDAAGQVERCWSTLIDPGAGVDVGPTHIHGLVAEELIGAPGLDDVADLFVADLAGRAVVAHNARFDVGFLTQALGTRGLLDRGARVPRVCTMEWACHFMTTPSRRLTTCCEVAGVEIGRHHNALDDAGSRWPGSARWSMPTASPVGTGMLSGRGPASSSSRRAPHPGLSEPALSPSPRGRVSRRLDCG